MRSISYCGNFQSLSLYVLKWRFAIDHQIQNATKAPNICGSPDLKNGRKTMKSSEQVQLIAAGKYSIATEGTAFLFTMRKILGGSKYGYMIS